MAMKVRYTTFDGEIVSENRGGVIRDYVPDPLGSTVALLDNTQTQTDTFNYWSYGESQTRTGATQTAFQFVGTQGYYRDSSDRTYVQNQELNVAEGRWMTANLFPDAKLAGNGYRYALNNPTSYALRTVAIRIDLPLQRQRDLQTPTSKYCSWSPPDLSKDWGWYYGCTELCRQEDRKERTDFWNLYLKCLAQVPVAARAACKAIYKKDLADREKENQRCLAWCRSHTPELPPPPKREPRTLQKLY